MKKLITILLCIQLLTLASCKDGFQELNKNPNSSEFALPQSFLAPTLVNVVSTNLTRSRRINNELMQVHVNMGDSEGRVFRYDIRATEADYMWNNWFVSLTSFKSMYASAEELFKVNANNTNKTYMGISLICQAWVFSMLTDTYGDIPYFDANKGKDGILTPKFDKQQVVYEELFKSLEQANELLKTNANLPADQVGSDPVYGGVAANWRKFGNSLYLRLLLRISAKSPIDIPAKIKDMVVTKASTYPLMTSNAESAILRWTGVLPYQSPFQNLRDADWNDTKAAEFFVNNLKSWSDPRIAKWIALKDGQYNGMPSGYPVGSAPVAKSLLPVALKTDPLLGNIMNYSELQYILAEVALRGWITALPQTYYDQGVTNGITLWGYTVPANYMNNVNIKWDDADSFDGKLERIHLQKYYSLFYTDFEQWFEYRRTGHPALVIGAGVQNNGEMPSRINYPAYLQSANRDNYNSAVTAQGPDNIATKVWWQRP